MQRCSCPGVGAGSSSSSRRRCRAPAPASAAALLLLLQCVVLVTSQTAVPPCGSVRPLYACSMQISDLPVFSGTPTPEMLAGNTGLSMGLQGLLSSDPATSCDEIWGYDPQAMSSGSSSGDTAAAASKQRWRPLGQAAAVPDPGKSRHGRRQQRPPRAETSQLSRPAPAAAAQQQQQQQQQQGWGSSRAATSSHMGAPTSAAAAAGAQAGASGHQPGLKYRAASLSAVGPAAGNLSAPAAAAASTTTTTAAGTRQGAAHRHRSQLSQQQPQQMGAASAAAAAAAAAAASRHLLAADSLVSAAAATAAGVASSWPEPGGHETAEAYLDKQFCSKGTWTAHLSSSPLMSRVSAAASALAGNASSSGSSVSVASVSAASSSSSGNGGRVQTAAVADNNASVGISSHKHHDKNHKHSKHDSAGDGDAWYPHPPRPRRRTGFRPVWGDDGLWMSESGVAPADATLAAGPRHILHIVNGLVKIIPVDAEDGLPSEDSSYNDGDSSYGASSSSSSPHQPLIITLPDFFGLVASDCDGGYITPSAAFDKHLERFVVTAVCGGDANQILVAVSQCADATDGWWLYAFPGYATFDTPMACTDGELHVNPTSIHSQVTYNRDGVFVSFVQNCALCNVPRATGAVLYALPKWSLYSGATSAVVGPVFTGLDVLDAVEQYTEEFEPGSFRQLQPVLPQRPEDVQADIAYFVNDPISAAQPHRRTQLTTVALLNTGSLWQYTCEDDPAPVLVARVTGRGVDCAFNEDTLLQQPRVKHMGSALNKAPGMCGGLDAGAARPRGFWSGGAALFANQIYLVDRGPDLRTQGPRSGYHSHNSQLPTVYWAVLSPSLCATGTCAAFLGQDWGWGDDWDWHTASWAGDGDGLPVTQRQRERFFELYPSSFSTVSAAALPGNVSAAASQLSLGANMAAHHRRRRLQQQQSSSAAGAGEAPAAGAGQQANVSAAGTGQQANVSAAGHAQVAIAAAGIAAKPTPGAKRSPFLPPAAAAPKRRGFSADTSAWDEEAEGDYASLYEDDDSYAADDDSDDYAMGAVQAGTPGPEALPGVPAAPSRPRQRKKRAKAAQPQPTPQPDAAAQQQQWEQPPAAPAPKAKPREQPPNLAPSPAQQPPPQPPAPARKQQQQQATPAAAAPAAKSPAPAAPPKRVPRTLPGAPATRAPPPQAPPTPTPTPAATTAASGGPRAADRAPKFEAPRKPKAGSAASGKSAAPAASKQDAADTYYGYSESGSSSSSGSSSGDDGYYGSGSLPGWPAPPRPRAPRPFKHPSSSSSSDWEHHSSDGHGHGSDGHPDYSRFEEEHHHGDDHGDGHDGHDHKHEHKHKHHEEKHHEDKHHDGSSKKESKAASSKPLLKWLDLLAAHASSGGKHQHHKQDHNKHGKTTVWELLLAACNRTSSASPHSHAEYYHLWREHASVRRLYSQLQVEPCYNPCKFKRDWHRDTKITFGVLVSRRGVIDQVTGSGGNPLGLAFPQVVVREGSALVVYSYSGPRQVPGTVELAFPGVGYSVIPPGQAMGSPAFNLLQAGDSCIYQGGPAQGSRQQRAWGSYSGADVHYPSAVAYTAVEFSAHPGSPDTCPSNAGTWLQAFAPAKGGWRGKRAVVVNPPAPYYAPAPRYELYEPVQQPPPPAFAPAYEPLDDDLYDSDSRGGAGGGGSSSSSGGRGGRDSSGNRDSSDSVFETRPQPEEPQQQPGEDADADYRQEEQTRSPSSSQPADGYSDTESPVYYGGGDSPPPPSHDHDDSYHNKRPPPPSHSYHHHGSPKPPSPPAPEYYPDDADGGGSSGGSSGEPPSEDEGLDGPQYLPVDQSPYHDSSSGSDSYYGQQDDGAGGESGSAPSGSSFETSPRPMDPPTRSNRKQRDKWLDTHATSPAEDDVEDEEQDDGGDFSDGSPPPADGWYPSHGGGAHGDGYSKPPPEPSYPGEGGGSYDHHHHHAKPPASKSDIHGGFVLAGPGRVNGGAFTRHAPPPHYYSSGADSNLVTEADADSTTSAAEDGTQLSPDSTAAEPTPQAQQKTALMLQQLLQAQLLEEQQKLQQMQEQQLLQLQQARLIQQQQLMQQQLQQLQQLQQQRGASAAAGAPQAQKGMVLPPVGLTESDLSLASLSQAPAAGSGGGGSTTKGLTQLQQLLQSLGLQKAAAAGGRQGADTHAGQANISQRQGASLAAAPPGDLAATDAAEQAQAAPSSSSSSSSSSAEVAYFDDYDVSSEQQQQQVATAAAAAPLPPAAQAQPEQPAGKAAAADTLWSYLLGGGQRHASSAAAAAQPADSRITTASSGPQAVSAAGTNSTTAG